MKLLLLSENKNGCKLEFDYKIMFSMPEKNIYKLPDYKFSIDFDIKFYVS